MIVVLRASSGDRCEIIDSGGRRFAARLEIDGDVARARLEGERAAPTVPKLEIDLAQGIPKGTKMDFVVEKATELGVARIRPFSATRTVGEGDREGKVARWRRLAKSAAQQCGRTDIPAVMEPVAWPALVGDFAAYDLVLVPWELAPPVRLRSELQARLDAVRRVLVAIGPEGGYTDEEISLGRAGGAHAISLGQRILRTETAGLAVICALRYESGDM